MTQTLVSLALAQNIGNTGLVFFALAWLLRHLSPDEAPSGWMLFVVFMGALGLSMAVSGALLVIWSA